MIKSYSQVRDDRLSGVMERTALTNLNPGSVIRTLLEVIAKPLSDLYQLVMTVTRGGFIQTAEGKWLDLKVRELGLERKPGVKASGYVTFFRDEGKPEEVVIPAGTIVKTVVDSEAKSYRFKTTEDGVIESGSSEAIVLVEADEIGLDYNVGKNTLIKINAHITGVDGVANKDVDTGSGVRGWQVDVGTDEESDELLRTRAIYRWDELGVGGTADAYRSWVLSVPGVSSVQVLDNFPFGPGTVGLIVASENGLPTLELLDEVSRVVNEKKPLTATVHVLSPNPKIVDLSVSLERFSTFTADVIEDSVRYNLLSINTDMVIGEKLVISRLIAELMKIEGIYSVEITTPSQNVAAEPDELIQIGEIEITQSIKGRSYQDTEIIAGANNTVMGV